MKLTSTSHYIPDCVIFDMDGLIFDSERLFYNQLKETAKHYGYTITKEKYVQTLGLTGTTLKETMFRLFDHQYPLEEISKKTREQMNVSISSNGIPIKEGIIDLLTYLQNQKIPCAVASSTKVSVVTMYLEKARLLSYFTVVIGGDMVSNSKPAPDIFLKACELLHSSPNHSLVLEDSENGILAAHNANIPVICIPDMKYPEETFAKLSSAIVTDAGQVLSLLG